ncbi:hypothetical protein F5I97DRAFT_396595 [Phlebopus sp. FC_14]|nr:hypothetical protein F5I97DRAFT_396595 [Phlebopus sp. FC_14]
MVEKTLSTGTLNLRFMQNARRAAAQHDPGIDEARAHVKDDAEWEVSEEVRRAWGLVSVAGRSSAYGRGDREEEDEVKSVTYEASYLPFLFPSLRGTSPPSASSSSPARPSTSQRAPRGRRIFNKRGEEQIVGQETSISTTADNDNNANNAHADDTRNLRPTSISGRGGEPTKKKPNKNPNPHKDARRVIFENDVSAVGKDLRTRKVEGPSAPGFLRPKGVDDATPHLASRPPKASMNKIGVETRPKAIAIATAKEEGEEEEGEEEEEEEENAHMVLALASSPNMYTRASHESRVGKRVRGLDGDEGRVAKKMKTGKKKKVKKGGKDMGVGVGKTLEMIE